MIEEIREPIVEVETQIFCEYWEEILFASFEGFPLITPDKKYVMEFLNKPKAIYSNFNIWELEAKLATSLTLLYKYAF